MFSDEYTRYPKLSSIPRVTYKWFHNCSPSLPSGVHPNNSTNNVSLIKASENMFYNSFSKKNLLLFLAANQSCRVRELWTLHLRGDIQQHDRDPNCRETLH